jgi:hypothetical protein
MTEERAACSPEYALWFAGTAESDSPAPVDSPVDFERLISGPIKSQSCCGVSRLFGIEAADWDLLREPLLILAGCLAYLAVVPPQFNDETQVRDGGYHLYRFVWALALMVAIALNLFSSLLSLVALSATVFVGGL